MDIKKYLKYADDDLPIEVIERAYYLFDIMGIPEDDFGIQHSDMESAIFGGTNRLIANLNWDTNTWHFRIDEPLMNPRRIPVWNAIPDNYKKLHIN